MAGLKSRDTAALTSRADDIATAPIKEITKDFSTKPDVPVRRFDLRHETPGIRDALATFDWLDPLLTEYNEHFPAGAEDSIVVSGMIHEYTKEHPESYTTEEGLIVVSAGATHDVGKVRVPKDDLNSNVVYTKEERMQKLAKHVEEGFLMIVGGDTVADVNLADIDHAKRKTALIMGGHHFNQDDRGSYPPANTPWLQTDDPFVLENRKVLIVADRVDALRTERSYKRSFTEKETVDSLAKQGFEGELVDFMLNEHARQTSQVKLTK
jgi:hypothetical protein